MLIVGLTGGIGSGKTTIGKAFATLGVSVYNCDAEAHRLTDTDPDIVSGLTSLFGADIYAGGRLDRKRLASIIFADSEALAAVNAIIHPVVRRDFAQWCRRHEAQGEQWVLCETAILFESGMDRLMDKIIVASLPVEPRIERAMIRDAANREQIAARIRAQVSNEDIERRADFVISSDDRHFVLPQIIEIDKQLKYKQQAE